MSRTPNDRDTIEEMEGGVQPFFEIPRHYRPRDSGCRNVVLGFWDAENQRVEDAVSAVSSMRSPTFRRDVSLRA